MKVKPTLDHGSDLKRGGIQSKNGHNRAKAKCASPTPDEKSIRGEKPRPRGNRGKYVGNKKNIISTGYYQGEGGETILPEKL